MKWNPFSNNKKLVAYVIGICLINLTIMAIGKIPLHEGSLGNFLFLLYLPSFHNYFYYYLLIPQKAYRYIGFTVINIIILLLLTIISSLLLFPIKIIIYLVPLHSLWYLIALFTKKYEVTP